MKELTDKLLSVRYKTKYPTLPHKYPEIYKLVEDANKSLLFEPISNLTRIASVFFVQECQPLPLETQTQETLHLFLKWTLVANLNNSVSETNYKQSYLLPELVDHLETDAVIAAIKDNLKMMI